MPNSACTPGAQQSLGPGRPRDENIDARILDATTGLLSAGADITVSAVVRASGVSRAALYRRWPSITLLTAAALDSGRTEYPEVTIDENLRQSLLATLVPGLTSEPHSAHSYSLQRFLQRMRLILVNPELQHAYWESHVARRRKPLEESLRQAVAQGILRSDLDVESTIDALAGIVYYQLLVRGDELNAPETRNRIVQAFDSLWRGMTA